jgi:bifunctional enzyme CysN/CysC
MADNIELASHDQIEKAFVDKIDTSAPLCILTCGSVDDGKSTLIGRLLYEKSLIPDDQLAALMVDSTKHGNVGDDIDFSLLLDGLEAERDQGITIDVAYRYFATKKRSFIVADTPGHEQFTRNMATGASHADVAIILVDARKGLLNQTFRHSHIVSLLGVRHIVLAVNKIDLVDFDQSAFDAIVSDFGQFAQALRFDCVFPIPLSARYGDNVSSKSPRMPWYAGPDLVSYLETVDITDDRRAKPFRMAVQWVNRPHLDFRGFAGTIASGGAQVGDEILIARSGKVTKIQRILLADGDVNAAEAGDAVTLVLADEIDIARGDMLAPPKARPRVSNQFAANLIWMEDQHMLSGRSYLLKIGTQTTPATVTELKYRLDVATSAKHAAKTLELNEIGFCNLSTSTPVAFDPYESNRATGSFILIDRYTNATAAAGLIEFELRRATNIHHQDMTVTKQSRAAIKHQKPAVIWFTGLSGAGKSTIANLVEAQLCSRGVHTILLDGDNIRHGLNNDLGFTDTDRVENIRRVGEVAKLMIDAGLIVICAFISPFRAERRLVRELVAEGEFIEVFVDTPLEECVSRDPKGLYKKALAGELKNFTGIDQAYETPENPDIHLLAGKETVTALAQRVLDELTRRHLI